MRDSPPTCLSKLLRESLYSNLWDIPQGVTWRISFTCDNVEHPQIDRKDMTENRELTINDTLSSHEIACNLQLTVFVPWESIQNFPSAENLGTITMEDNHKITCITKRLQLLQEKDFNASVIQMLHLKPLVKEIIHRGLFRRIFPSESVAQEEQSVLTNHQSLFIWSTLLNDPSTEITQRFEMTRFLFEYLATLEPHCESLPSIMKFIKPLKLSASTSDRRFQIDLCKIYGIILEMTSREIFWSWRDELSLISEELTRSLVEMSRILTDIGVVLHEFHFNNDSHKNCVQRHSAKFIAPLWIFHLPNRSSCAAEKVHLHFREMMGIKNIHSAGRDAQSQRFLSHAMYRLYTACCVDFPQYTALVCEAETSSDILRWRCGGYSSENWCSHRRAITTDEETRRIQRNISDSICIPEHSLICCSARNALDAAEDSAWKYFEREESKCTKQMVFFLNKLRKARQPCLTHRLHHYIARKQKSLEDLLYSFLDAQMLLQAAVNICAKDEERSIEQDKYALRALGYTITCIPYFLDMCRNFQSHSIVCDIAILFDRINQMLEIKLWSSSLGETCLKLQEKLRSTMQDTNLQILWNRIASVTYRISNRSDRLRPTLSQAAILMQRLGFPFHFVLKYRILFQEAQEYQSHDLPTANLKEFSVSRSNALSDSLAMVHSLRLHVNKQSVVKKMFEYDIVWKDEIGRGAGVMKDWFEVTLRSAFLEKPQCWIQCEVGSGHVWIPSHCASPTTGMLELYTFMGFLIGLGMFKGYQMAEILAPSILKAICTNVVHAVDEGSLEDEFKRFYPVVWNSFSQMEAMTKQDLKDAGLMMEFSGNRLNTTSGEMERHSVILGKSRAGNPLQIRSKEDVISYRKSYIRYCLVDAIAQQVEAIQKGYIAFGAVHSSWQLFTNQELLKMFLSPSEINLKSWEAFVDFQWIERKNSLPIHPDEIRLDDFSKWFWRFVATLSNEAQARLLRFWTGSQTLPSVIDNPNQRPLSVCIYREARFTGQQDQFTFRFPSAQTCFKELILPPYPSESVMHAKLTEFVGLQEVHQMLFDRD